MAERELAEVDAIERKALGLSPIRIERRSLRPFRKASQLSSGCKAEELDACASGRASSLRLGTGVPKRAGSMVE